MMKYLERIPLAWRIFATFVAAVTMFLGYHSTFMTKAEAAEQASRQETQLILARIDSKQSERRTLRREKEKALKMNDTVEVELLQDDIAVLDMEIDRLCKKVDC